MYGDGTIWYDKARKKYCYDYCDNDGKRHRKRFATEKEAKEFKKEIRAERDKGNLTSSSITIGEWVIEFLETYQMARKVGFKNINVDLMLGIPNQRIKDLKESLEEVIKLKPEHISVYSLIVEDGTPIANKIQKCEMELPDEDTERNMYWYVKNTLELNGYKHYEISNFAKKGYESKHNMNCWNQMEYVGIGTAAHSYRDITRYSNTEDIKEYIKNVQKGEFEKNRIIHEIQKEEDSKKEFMLLGLRKIDGLKISEFKNKFGDNPIYLYRNELKKLSDEKLIIIQDDNIRLSNKGIDLANLVWEEFV